MTSIPPLFICFTIILSCGDPSAIQDDAPRCSDSVQSKVSVAKQEVNVAYTEPSVTADNTPLDDLLKTSIYYDFGQGRRLAKDVPATQLSGGSQIFEAITIPTNSQQEQSVNICATATDQSGNESEAAP